VRTVIGCLLLLVGSLHATPRLVCVDDQVGLAPPAQASMYQELTVLLGNRKVRLDSADCDAAENGAIRLFIRRQGPLADILGRAQLDGSRVAPRLEVFLVPVLDLLQDPTCWASVGRALGRVAAHEVTHYLDQIVEHDPAGLMRAGFTRRELAAEDSFPFWLQAIRQK
jgi:hypothetical protein